MKEEDALSQRVCALFKTRSFNQEAEALMHAAVGVSGEAGELLDAVKKCWAYHKPIDRVNVVEELGDLEFYMEAVRQQLDISRIECLYHNRYKLAKRFPDGFYKEAAAQLRADKN